MYCKKCGGKLESYASNCAFCGEPVEKYDAEPKYIKQERRDTAPHMTTGKWIGLVFLNAIPLIGQIIYLILMFKWAFGDNRDLTLKSYARANLLLILISIILAAGVVVLALSGFIPELQEIQ